MARAFRATTRGYKADLDTHERRLLSQLCADVIVLLERRSTEVDAAVHHGDTEELDEFAHFRRELAGLGSGEFGESSGLEPPDDPVLARLLPNGGKDEDDSGQLRRLAEGSLREAKINDLRTARMLLQSDPVTVTEEQAPALGRALNDVRLTLATRLGIKDEADAEEVHRTAVQRKVTTPEHFMAEIYAFTTWLQETLFSAMLDVLPEAE